MDKASVPIFEYGRTEIDYLKNKDAALAHAIEHIGKIERPIIPDLFEALISSIIGQQISIKAWDTVWNRMRAFPGGLSIENILASSVESIQQCGMTKRKAVYIQQAAYKIYNGELDIHSLHDLSDEDICKRLSEFNGIGAWTAEMLMIFSMQRPNVFSFGDIAIHRGLRILYRHRNIDKKKFEKFRRRYSPYCSVASLYLWSIACGAMGERLTDPAALRKRKIKVSEVNSKLKNK